MTNEELIEIILPWAKEHHQDKYTQTLAVAKDARTFRRFLIRLIEIRHAEEPEWLRTAEWGSVPTLSVLEESAIAMKVRLIGTETELTVKGKLAAGEREWTFAELAMLVNTPEESRRETLDMLIAAKRELDLVHAE